MDAKRNAATASAAALFLGAHCRTEAEIELLAGRQQTQGRVRVLLPLPFRMPFAISVLSRFCAGPAAGALVRVLKIGNQIVRSSHNCGARREVQHSGPISGGYLPVRKPGAVQVRVLPPRSVTATPGENKVRKRASFVRGGMTSTSAEICEWDGCCGSARPS
jgi:hypothetical protein